MPLLLHFLSLLTALKEINDHIQDCELNDIEENDCCKSTDVNKGVNHGKPLSVDVLVLELNIA